MSKSLTKAEQQTIAEQKANLLKWIPKGTTVYTICNHVSRSGMMRHIRLVVFLNGDKEPTPIFPNYATSKVLGYRQDPHSDALIVSGAGMDMGFHLVYSLGQALYGDGYALTHHWL